MIDDDIERRLRKGISHKGAGRLAREIESADLDQDKRRVAAEELEAACERREDLKEQIERCRRLLDRSRRWVDFEPEPFRAALSCSLETASQDITGLLPQLEERAERVARSAANALRDRGESEARGLRVTLERQRQRVEVELGKHEAAELQLTLEFNDKEKRQRQADVAARRTRLSQFDYDLETEPARIRNFYEVRAQRVEPIGLVYLWPDTG